MRDTESTPILAPSNNQLANWMSPHPHHGGDSALGTSSGHHLHHGPALRGNWKLLGQTVVVVVADDGVGSSVCAFELVEVILHREG